MYYVVYVIAMIYLLIRGAGDGGNFLNYLDAITAFFLLQPCVLILFCTKSLRAFGRSVLFACGKRDYASRDCEESLQAVKMTMITVNVVGVIGFVISTINSLRHWGWTPLTDEVNWPLLDLSVAVLSILYALIICVFLLPVYFMLKKHLILREHTALEERAETRNRAEKTEAA